MQVSFSCSVPDLPQHHAQASFFPLNFAFAILPATQRSLTPYFDI
jgi:hypothetical protein